MNHEENCTNSCPFDSLNRLFSRKWILYILRDLFIGKKYFNEFKKSNPLMSNVSLSNNLKYLESEGLIIKINRDNQKHTIEYHLTKKGKKLNKVIYEMIIFGLSELVSVSDEEAENIKNQFQDVLLNYDTDKIS